MYKLGYLYYFLIKKKSNTLKLTLKLDILTKKIDNLNLQAMFIL